MKSNVTFCLSKQKSIKLDRKDHWITFNIKLRAVVGSIELMLKINRPEERLKVSEILFNKTLLTFSYCFRLHFPRYPKQI